MRLQRPETHSRILGIGTIAQQYFRSLVCLGRTTPSNLPVRQVMMTQPAKLALEDGTVLTGTSFGAQGEVDGEVVFNTSMTGYQEILTDPSYRGQIVTMTYTQIGNYGVNDEDVESSRPHLAGFIVRENSRVAQQLPRHRHLA